ncbi:FMN phosphatase YigB (HAD superfamily) [Natranaerovirga hydrolytica]|uniref:FMN phosphatase YigB (HAD superfamily) n=1 Tax=Natranaerovirga hydrolytica TaxID=680378 RepID=A0A4R1M6V5_9FIRM|nr:HAD family hydrolase [Natranaerovirga hydrolytica]TCK88008.1 FMN phosphatase YigB (HAD superfamily) [Natranaerovirga hydrolytica]
MINTILFDLDGTVLPLDTEVFMKVYFDEMSQSFKDLIDEKTLVKYVWAATKEMVQNNEKRSNESVFMETFSGLIKEDINIYKDRFDKFYDEGFHKAKVAVKTKNDSMEKTVRLLSEKNYNMVLATNPLFPKKAILHRIKWANIDPSVFSYITSYEQNNYCKPQLKYYNEILKAINKEARECLMIGNDVQEDLIAGKLGIKTYLVEDHMINREDQAIICDYKGKYEDLYEFVKALPVL